MNPRNDTNGTECSDSRSSGWQLFLLGGVASLQFGLFRLAVGRENLPGCVQVELPELLRQLDGLGHHSLQLIIVAHLQREFYRVKNSSSVSWSSIWRISLHSTCSSKTQHWQTGPWQWGQDTESRILEEEARPARSHEKVQGWQPALHSPVPAGGTVSMAGQPVLPFWVKRS